MLGDLPYDPARASARIHEVFRNRLKPVHFRLFRQDVVEMFVAKANAQTQFGQGADLGCKMCNVWHQAQLPAPLMPLEPQAVIP